MTVERILKLIEAAANVSVAVAAAVDDLSETMGSDDRKVIAARLDALRGSNDASFARLEAKLARIS